MSSINFWWKKRANVPHREIKCTTRHFWMLSNDTVIHFLRRMRECILPGKDKRARLRRSAQFEWKREMSNRSICNSRRRRQISSDYLRLSRASKSSVRECAGSIISKAVWPASPAEFMGRRQKPAHTNGTNSTCDFAPLNAFSHFASAH